MTHSTQLSADSDLICRIMLIWKELEWKSWHQCQSMKIVYSELCHYQQVILLTLVIIPAVQWHDVLPYHSNRSAYLLRWSNPRPHDTMFYPTIPTGQLTYSGDHTRGHMTRCPTILYQQVSLLTLVIIPKAPWHDVLPYHTNRSANLLWWSYPRPHDTMSYPTIPTGQLTYSGDHTRGPMTRCSTLPYQ